MRILKTKIALSAQAKVQHTQQAINAQEIQNQQIEKTVQAQNISTRPPSKTLLDQKNKSKKSPNDNNATKTIVKNYGRAIASFATTLIAVPYLTPLLNKERVKLHEFVNYISRAKDLIEGIDTFRALLLPKITDDPKLVAYKKIFKGIAEIFIKYFSVNWIFSGRMLNKEAHLRFRFKMLRRIRNPELFTYLK